MAWYILQDMEVVWVCIGYGLGTIYRICIASGLFTGAFRKMCDFNGTYCRIWEGGWQESWHVLQNMIERLAHIAGCERFIGTFCSLCELAWHVLEFMKVSLVHFAGGE